MRFQPAFLPTRHDEIFDPKKLLQQFQNTKEFQLFSFVNENNEPVSYISILPYKPCIISIGPMFVSEKARGQGLGKKQVEELIKWSKTENYSSIYTKTWSGNTASRKIFESLGFEKTEEIPNDRINGDASIKYLLNL